MKKRPNRGYLVIKPSVGGVAASRESKTEEEVIKERQSRPIPMIYTGDAPLDAEDSQPASTQPPLTLRPGHESRPIWVCSDGRIFFEASMHPDLFGPVSELLVAIAEPVCRPKHIHEYQITVCSLYAAISLGMDATEILDNLRKLAKNEIDQTLQAYIGDHGSRIGKARLVLRRGRFFVESVDQELLKLLENSTDKIRAAKIKESAYNDVQIPLLEEFEFREEAAASAADVSNAEPQLHISLRPTTQVRNYQEGSLHKMFSGNRARSGMIVLPCGAGKTLVGILATSTMKRRTMVLTTTAVAVDQWKRQFEFFCNIDPADVIVLTADSKQSLPEEDRACILISTYSMFSVAYDRMSRSSRAVLDQVRNLEWGLLVVDEVQVMPAKTFRTVATTVRAHCKLGLTATLVREDDLIEDLQYLIGPKLYEANWQELQDAGFIAKVKCIEVWSAMPSLFWAAYLNSKSHHVNRALYTCNPRKLAACECLIRLHEQRNDKIIVFCDNVTLLQHMARALRKPFICGSVSMQERMACIRAFQHSSKINTIFLSQVGDNAIDIPNANVVIQISSHYGSRRQEAQRLGRILRPKAYRDSDGFNAYFYSLVSRDTPEKTYAERRQTFLVDQGYAFTIIADFDERVDNMIKEGDRFEYMQDDVQKLLLKRCLEGSALELEAEEDVGIVDSQVQVTEEFEQNFIARFGSAQTGSLSDLTGGGGKAIYSG
jgi:DNA excision repair protein ERCC-3